MLLFKNSFKTKQQMVECRIKGSKNESFPCTCPSHLRCIENVYFGNWLFLANVESTFTQPGKGAASSAGRGETKKSPSLGLVVVSGNK